MTEQDLNSEEIEVAPQETGQDVSMQAEDNAQELQKKEVEERNWKAMRQRQKEMETELRHKNEMLFMAGGPRMDHGVKISEVTREGGYDYKTFCDIMISEEMLEPYKKPDSKYMKVTLY